MFFVESPVAAAVVREKAGEEQGGGCALKAALTNCAA